MGGDMNKFKKISSLIHTINSMEYTRYVVLWCIGHGYCTIKGVKRGRT